MSSSFAGRSTFNGPVKRAELLLLPQYAASDVFLSTGKWTGTKNHILSVDSSDVDATVPLYCIVVGTISSNKVFLGKHGNFSTKFTEDAQKAKLQFTVTRPDDVDFGPDFDKAVIAFQEQQSVISESPQQLFFLSKEEGNAMRMNFGLFDPRGDNNDIDRDRETRVYSVDSQYATYWSTAKIHNYCSIMPVFDTSDAPVDPNRFTDKLVGATCEITFTLKHIAIASRRKPDGSVMEATDVFSAHVESMAVLKNPPTVAHSPYKGRIMRRPQHRPQLPSRGEQVNASVAFVPRPDFGPKFVGKSTKSSLPARAKAGIDSEPIGSATPSTLGDDASPEDGADDVPSALAPAPTSTTLLFTGNSTTSQSGVKPQASSSSITTLTSEDDQYLDDFVDIPASSNKRKYNADD